MTETGSVEGDSAPRRLLLHELTREEAVARCGDALLVVPVGATEQHGPHLPLGTDFLIVEYVARAAAGSAAGQISVVVAPTMPFGSSHHHLPFGGTASLTTERYYGAMTDTIESLIRSGFRRIFILNGHGGNHELAQLTARDLALRCPANIAAASYWDIAKHALAAVESDPYAPIPGHAGVFETSLIHALHPSLVRSIPQAANRQRMNLAGPTLSYRAELHGSWQRIAGFTDHPDRASAERGDRYLGAIIPAVRDAFVEFFRMPLHAG
ncbi:MAG: creatininase family protein [Thermomicrobiales bacterium]|nr:creatininase family protein [Thermomicrobiales bacterium]